MMHNSTAGAVCSLSPFLRGEGWGEGRRPTRSGLPLTPTLSPPQERGEGATAPMALPITSHQSAL
jgi:hypothetical protein